MMVFKICENIEIVTGVLRCCIYDFERKEYYFVPLNYNNLLKSLDGQNLQQVDLLEPAEIEWVKWSIDMEFLLLVPKKLFKYFISKERIFKSSSIVYSMTIEYTTDLLRILLPELSKVGCKHLVLILNEVCDLDKTYDLFFGDCSLTSIKILLKTVATPEIIDSYQKKWNRVVSIEYFSHSELMKQDRISKSFNPNFYLSNLIFLEALEFNTYFNRNLFLGEDGNLRTHISSIDTICNIFIDFNCNLIELLKKRKDKLVLWNVNKNMIYGCRFCEFRFMCVDSRIPEFDDNLKLWKYSSKCCYEPENAKWDLT